MPEDSDGSTAELLPVPGWLTATHMAFMAWTVVTSHYPALFVGGFLIFLGFARATSAYQSRIELKGPLLVGFFLAGLVIHGGLQGWWIAPVLASLSETPLFLSATVLTAFNDNALITYLATLVPNLSEGLKVAVVEGAVDGRRPDRHRQRAESGGAGAALALLRRLDQADRAAARRAAPDADCHRRVPASVVDADRRQRGACLVEEHATSELPLSGIRVIDLTRVLAGPLCTMLLGDMGAEVIKIEDPDHGDDTRDWAPFVDGWSTYFLGVNRNKKSVAIDLKSDDGAALLDDLIRSADVLVENFRPGTLDAPRLRRRRARAS